MHEYCAQFPIPISKVSPIIGRSSCSVRLKPDPTPTASRLDWPCPIRIYVKDHLSVLRPHFPDKVQSRLGTTGSFRPIRTLQYSHSGSGTPGPALQLSMTSSTRATVDHPLRRPAVNREWRGCGDLPTIQFSRPRIASHRPWLCPNWSAPALIRRQRRPRGGSLIRRPC
ncbi:hypothetical protein BO70DRAFT_162004 [Aspergillus heteromorphus CBS 117.55]|uniref:Uncharacterized protein n=1 Tax=Aspergillus heteromorphus CBS 117.55 TaxID=1448321 RepID=A0A317WRR7_9EURO|nr:uncharacterized protein BO70DRAFT_162004 [Aspergillus heteromorphus CBS 117.55]PWY89144.1 hypothetical protein BO70DRAFT_162004 [Aspergillus heteromorphus CBS 117.55]